MIADEIVGGMHELNAIAVLPQRLDDRIVRVAVEHVAAGNAVVVAEIHRAVVVAAQEEAQRRAPRVGVVAEGVQDPEAALLEFRVLLRVVEAEVVYIGVLAPVRVVDEEIDAWASA